MFIVASLSWSQQQFEISGEVTDSGDRAIPFANVLLFKTEDASLVKGMLTDENGKYVFERIARGNYYIKSELLGYNSSNSQNFELSADYNLPTLILSEGEALDEVLVEAKKPLFVQKVDRLVINVENSIVSTGGTALEVLERSPGIVVNRQNNLISVVGKDGVVVMINGRTSYVPASTLVQMLDGMAADTIESIEVITTPPANFDAEGNAGFINIVLKKNSNLGANGSYSISMGYGKGIVSNDNINFNYRNDKLNVFGNYSFRLDKREQLISTSRDFVENEDLFSTNSRSERKPTQRNHNLRTGLDYQLSEKTIAGLILTGFDNRWSMDALNNSFDEINGVFERRVLLANSEINRLRHFGGNFNIKHDFNEEDYISLDLDYLYYEFYNPTDYENSFFDENNDFDRLENLRSRKDTPLNTWVAKLDYFDELSDAVKVETGVKLIRNDFENDVSVDNLIDQEWINDTTLTNFSVLDESIMAAYGTMDYTISEKTSLKAGLRYEYTDSKLDVDTQGRVVDRQYGIWFPSVFLNHKWSDNLSMNWSYSKRITRPTFNDLAPFVIFLEPNTFISGNASLQPAISQTFKFDINFKSYFLSFQYTDQDSSIANFQERIDNATGRLIFEAANLNYTRTFSIIAGIPVKITNWWRTQNNLTYVDQTVSSIYDDDLIELNLGIFSANSSHSFKLSENLSAELSGFYNGPGFFGNAKYNEIYALNFGLEQKFGEKWGTLKFAVNDFLDSLEFRGGTNLPDQNFSTQNVFDFSNRTFLLTYTRNFGNKELRSARNRETGSEEERRRINN